MKSGEEITSKDFLADFQLLIANMNIRLST